MSYKIEYTAPNGISSVAYIQDTDVYTQAGLLEACGARDIRIFYKGEEIDHYVQGRSTRNLSSVPTTEGTRPAKRFNIGGWTITVERKSS